MTMFTDKDMDKIAKVVTYILETELWKKCWLSESFWVYKITAYKLNKDPKGVCKKCGKYLNKLLGTNYKITQDKIRDNLRLSSHNSKYEDWLNNYNKS